MILVANKVDDERSEAGAAELWSLGPGGAVPGQRAARPRPSGDLLDLVFDAMPEAPRETEEPGPAPGRAGRAGPTWASPA